MEHFVQCLAERHLKRIFFNQNVWIVIDISPNLNPVGPVWFSTGLVNSNTHDTITIITSASRACMHVILLMRHVTIKWFHCIPFNYMSRGCRGGKQSNSFRVGVFENLVGWGCETGFQFERGQLWRYKTNRGCHETRQHGCLVCEGKTGTASIVRTFCAWYSIIWAHDIEVTIRKILLIKIDPNLLWVQMSTSWIA